MDCDWNPLIVRPIDGRNERNIYEISRKDHHDQYEAYSLRNLEVITEKEGVEHADDVKMIFQTPTSSPKDYAIFASEYGNLSPYSKPWIPREKHHPIACDGNYPVLDVSSIQICSKGNYDNFGEDSYESCISWSFMNQCYSGYPLDGLENTENYFHTWSNDESISTSTFPSLYPLLPRCESADGFVYQVRFKYISKYFLLATFPLHEIDSQPQLIKNGDYVKVEADRGEDIGLVVGKTPLDGFKESRLAVGRFGLHIGEYKRVLRAATEEEISLLSAKVEEEERAANICRSKAFETGLCMRIIDAEFQYDRHKLTFYFESNRSREESMI